VSKPCTAKELETSLCYDETSVFQLNLLPIGFVGIARQS
jgi:hypothetical protein